MNPCPKVLIADDEQDCIDFIRDTLTDMPCEVISAADGEEALEVARQNQPDLIILDIQMPKRDGFNVFSELRADKNLAKVPVIMLTAVTQRTGMKFDNQDMDQYLGSEPEAFIDKPVEPIILKQTVKKLLGK